MVSILLFCICIALLSMIHARTSFACTTVLVGKEASETGEVLVGHNEDSGGRYVMRTYLVPEKNRVGKESIRFEPASAVLELPPKRAHLFWSEARPYIPDGGASFCDFYINGNGVVICSDNCGMPREDRPELTDGGIGYGVRRIVAESARSAFDAVEIAAGLLDKYGYLGNGRSYHFADKNEIWVLQVVNGKHYAVKRVPDDEVYLNPNHYTIRQPDPGTPGLEKLVSYAAERGWYIPERDGDFDFARTYQAPEAYRATVNFHRHLRGLEIVLGHPLDPEADLPFSVIPPRKIGVEDIKRILRCHFEGTPDDVSGGGSPHSMKTRPICTRTTLESSVVQIRPNHDLTLVRRALGRPCLAVYVPWYFGITRVPEEYAGGDSERELHTHFSVPASDLDYLETGAWWRHTDLQTAIDLLYREKAEEVRGSLLELEKKLEEELLYFEPLSAGHFRTDAAKAAELLGGSVADWATRAVRNVKGLYETLKILPMKISAPIDIGDSEASFAVRIPLPDTERDGFASGRIVLEKTLFGPSHAPLPKWSAASKSDIRQGELEISFGAADWMKTSPPCLTDVWAVVENDKGERLVGKALTALHKTDSSTGS